MYYHTRGPPPKQKPHPRAACAASPSPLERGVNSLANYSRTVVSVPRPPCGNLFGCWRTGRGDPCPTVISPA